MQHLKILSLHSLLSISMIKNQGPILGAFYYVENKGDD